MIKQLGCIYSLHTKYTKKLAENESTTTHSLLVFLVAIHLFYLQKLL